MKRVTGIGGIFFKSGDPQKTREWYQRHLGIQTGEYGSTFEWRHAEDPDRKGYTVWSPFEESTTYFEPSRKEFMINYRVDDLESLLAALREEGVEVVGEMEVYDYGKFGWILDPDGHKIELWEPVDSEYEEMAREEGNHNPSS